MIQVNLAVSMIGRHIFPESEKNMNWVIQNVLGLGPSIALATWRLCFQAVVFFLFFSHYFYFFNIFIGV